MVKIKLISTGNCLFVQAEGHALFNKKGRDIVCASVSVLLESWFISEKELCHANIDLKREKGFFSGKIADYGEKEKWFYDSLSLNLLILEKQYADYIKVIMEAPDG